MQYTWHFSLLLITCHHTLSFSDIKGVILKIVRKFKNYLARLEVIKLWAYLAHILCKLPSMENYSLQEKLNLSYEFSLQPYIEYLIF